jgi:hypothetical protein
MGELWAGREGEGHGGRDQREAESPPAKIRQDNPGRSLVGGPCPFRQIRDPGNLASQRPHFCSIFPPFPDESELAFSWRRQS